jgi:hypothetical protein
MENAHVDLIHEEMPIRPEGSQDTLKKLNNHI